MNGQTHTRRETHTHTHMHELTPLPSKYMKYYDSWNRSILFHFIAAIDRGQIFLAELDLIQRMSRAYAISCIFPPPPPAPTLGYCQEVKHGLSVLCM